MLQFLQPTLVLVLLALAGALAAEPTRVEVKVGGRSRSVPGTGRKDPRGCDLEVRVESETSVTRASRLAAACGSEVDWYAPFSYQAEAQTALESFLTCLESIRPALNCFTSMP